MHVTPIKTNAISPLDSLNNVFDTYLPKLKERDILVVTSKIVSICEGRVVTNDDAVDKDHLIESESDYYLDPSVSRYHVTLTIKNNMLVASSGIDESNGNGSFVLWPKNAHESADLIWQYLRTKHMLTHFGVLITDSRTVPLKWGTIGAALSWCGFVPLKNYIDEPDIYGKRLRMTKQSIIEGLAASAVLTMGEGNEQTPLAVICDVPFVEFVDHPPTKQERDDLVIDPKDDLYAPLLTSVNWKKGKRQLP